MARDSSGSKNQAQDTGTGLPADAADLSEIANYAALVGNRKAGTASARTALTGADLWIGLEFFETDTGLLYTYDSTGWTRVSMRLLADLDLGTIPTNITGTGSTWQDALSITATSHGGTVKAQWKALVSNNNSGSAQIASFRLVCDGVAIGTAQLDFNLALLSGATNKFGASFDHKSSPAAGSHVWKLQVLATAANACALYGATLLLTEI